MMRKVVGGKVLCIADNYHVKTLAFTLISSWGFLAEKHKI